MKGLSKYLSHQWLKGIVIGIWMCTACLPCLGRADVSKNLERPWKDALSRFVDGGLVDYHSLRNDPTLLTQYLDRLDQISINQFANMAREDRVAIWINLYNASVWKTIINHDPVDSVEQIEDFWTERSVRFLGERFSLREVRDEIIRKGFRDERILTALVSGRMDSPRIYPEPFEGDQLGQQLNEASRAFVDNGELNRIDPVRKRVFLSSLFDVFGDDFLLNYSVSEPMKHFSRREQAIISFILHHSADAEKRLFLNDGKYRIRFLASDDRLNDVKFLNSKIR